MHYDLGHFVWTLAWGPIKGHMWQRGREGTGWRKGRGIRNCLKLQRSREREAVPETFQVPALLSSASIAWGVCCDAVCKRLLAAIPELAWALTAGRLEAALRTSAGPHRASIPSAPEGTQLCRKQRQTDCRAGWKLGAVTEQVSLGHARIHRQGWRTLGFCHPCCPSRKWLQVSDLLSWPEHIWMLPLDPQPYDSPQPGWLWLSMAQGSD